MASRSTIHISITINWPITFSNYMTDHSKRKYRRGRVIQSYFDGSFFWLHFSDKIMYLVHYFNFHQIKSSSFITYVMTLNFIYITIIWLMFHTSNFDQICVTHHSIEIFKLYKTRYFSEYKNVGHETQSHSHCLLTPNF